MKDNYIITIIIILVFIANFIFLSVGFTQKGVNIGGYVPLTDQNYEATMNTINSDLDTTQAKYKENKYLYYFEKSQIEESKKASYTDYDKYTSYALMIIVMVLFAIILLLLLHYNDKFWHNNKIRAKDLKI